MIERGTSQKVPPKMNDRVLYTSRYTAFRKFSGCHIKSSRSQMFSKIGVRKYFVIFTGKQMLESLFKKRANTGVFM